MRAMCVLQLILTGVSTGKDDEGGAVVFFDKSRRTLVRKARLGGALQGAVGACAAPQVH